MNTRTLYITEKDHQRLEEYIDVAKGMVGTGEIGWPGWRMSWTIVASLVRKKCRLTLLLSTPRSDFAM